MVCHAALCHAVLCRLLQVLDDLGGIARIVLRFFDQYEATTPVGGWEGGWVAGWLAGWAEGCASGWVGGRPCPAVTRSPCRWVLQWHANVQL